jgi:hypothetical protein
MRRSEAVWQARRALRLVVIIGSCAAALDYALDHTDGLLAGSFVIVGAIAIGAWWAKEVWPEPKKTDLK